MNRLIIASSRSLVEVGAGIDIQLLVFTHVPRGKIWSRDIGICPFHGVTGERERAVGVLRLVEECLQSSLRLVRGIFNIHVQLTRAGVVDKLSTDNVVLPCIGRCVQIRRTG